jgi:hypothetical protein
MVRKFGPRCIGLVVKFIIVPLRGGKTYVVLIKGRREVGSPIILAGLLAMGNRLAFGLIVGWETFLFVIDFHDYT